MKKIIAISLLISCICSNTAQAQVTIYPGIKGGVNLSTFIGTETASASMLAGPYAGGLAQFSFSGESGFLTYIIQPEIFYSMQGAKTGNSKINLSYATLSAIVQRYIASSGFHIETGPQASFLLSAKSRTDDVTIDIKEELRKVDFSLVFGLGYKLDSGLGFNARYGISLTTLEKNNYDIRNATISIGLFYVFGQKEW